jgi:hypothetical protein
VRGLLLQQGPDQPYEFLLLGTLSSAQEDRKLDVLNLTT